MNNLDKQLIYAINEWLLNLTDGGFQLSKYSMGDDDTTWNAFEEIKKVTLEANKQSILKAIMEKKPKEKLQISPCPVGCEKCRIELSNWNTALEQFESVIKEILK